MLYSQAQLDEKLKAAGFGEEHEALLKLEREIRKAYHPVEAGTFNGQEVERMLTDLDILRAK